MIARRRMLLAAVLVAVVAGATILLTHASTSSRAVTHAAASRPPSLKRDRSLSRFLARRAARTGARLRRPLLRLSLPQLAGQRIIYAYAGLTPPPSLLSAIRTGEAG